MCKMLFLHNVDETITETTVIYIGNAVRSGKLIKVNRYFHRVAHSAWRMVPIGALLI